jgi:hypothetical protein
MAKDPATAPLAPVAPGEHPATLAWARLGAGCEPREVRVLKEKSGKSAVYWLAGAGRDGSPVVAKLCAHSSAELEDFVYTALRAVPGHEGLRYYGLVPEGASRAWLLLEGIDRPRYSPWEVEHRRAAARWLAALHSGTAGDERLSSLPDRGPEHHLSHLRSARTRIARQVLELDLAEADARRLTDLEPLLEVLESQWNLVEARCEGVPKTLVHADVSRQNVRVELPGRGVVAFDWEKAGWAVPATDLAQLRETQTFAGSPCLATYRAALGAAGIAVSAEVLEALGVLGTLFRCLAAIDWRSVGLTADWGARLIELGRYSDWTRAAMKSLGLESPAPRQTALAGRSAPAL